MGRFGTPFLILKFRTMTESPESYQGPKITGAEDSRITKIGAWLRDTKINELPQLWNVLIGEMSIVGPRPEDVDIARGWPSDVFWEILSVRPGITSPASITYKNEEKMLNGKNILANYFTFIQPDKIRLDLLYIRHYSMILDLNVIVSTFLYLLPSFRNASIPENALFGGHLYKFIRRYVQWIVIDSFVSVFLISLTGIVWRMIAPLNIGIWNALLFGLTLAAGFSLLMNIVGISSVEWSRASSEDSFGLFLSTSSLIVLALLLELSTARVPLPNGFIIINSFVVATGFYLIRNRKSILNGFYGKLKRFTDATVFLGERVLIIGAGEGGNIATWILSRPEFQKSIKLIGFIDDDYAKLGTKINGLEVLGSTEQIKDIVSQHDIGLIIMAIGGITLANKERILSRCDETGKTVIEITDLLSEFHGVFNVSERFGEEKA